MASRIKGATVKLYSKVAGDPDLFGRPIYTETFEYVDNVIISPTSSTEQLATYDLTGKKVVYTLGIPKGDAHVWQDNDVEFFGQRWHCLNIPQEGIEENIPLDWHKIVMVERYE